MKYIKQKAFTLVELIVVVTILAILATIGFVSYSSYLTGVRDTNRLAQLVSIHDWLELFRTKKDLPLPDESVDVKINATETIAFQWFAGSNVLETIDFTKWGQDPRDGVFFSYYLTDDRKFFQLMAFLEEDASITTQAVINNSAQAVDYSSRVPTIYGKKLWILTDEDNTPIQDIQEIQDNWGLDISSTTTIYKAHFEDNDFIEWDSSVLSNLDAIALLWGKGSIAPTWEILFEANWNWNYVDESSRCIDEELFGQDKLEQIQRLFDNWYTNITIDTDINLIYGGDDSTPRHFVYAKKISDLTDFNMNINSDAGNNTTLRLFDTDKSLMRCTWWTRCWAENRPAVNTNSEPLFIYRVNLQPVCDWATALNDLWSRNSFTFTGSYYRILMQ